MQIAALLTTAVLSTIAPAHASNDPLFALMEGHWIGQGERVQLGSGRRIAIEAEVDSHVDDTNVVRLFSWNQVRETAPDGARRTYQKRYWIQHIGGANYLLGGARSIDDANLAARARRAQDVGPTVGTVGTLSAVGNLALTGALPPNGVFSDNTFTVRQDLGGTPALRVESITHFEPNRTHFAERLWQGDRAVSETHIDYGRVTPPR